MNGKPSDNSIDFSAIAESQKLMCEAVKDSETIRLNVAKALQVKEFMSELEKNLLSKYKAKAIGAGAAKSDAMAETIARADVDYAKEFTELRAQYQSAMEVIEQRRVLEMKFEAARSVLSSEKVLAGMV